ncbi:hypothetical protein AA23498_0341 [Acetobacter nitrogenifigens DSM 23921 = NBRC 105050]|nr:hypothetical protein AA23498_0341 [Acetobacter nitrogenifigens DSM 23921 = NBRC 105050]
MTASDAKAYSGVLPAADRSSFKPSKDAQFYAINAAGQTVGYLYSETQNWKGDDRGPCLLTWLDPQNGHVGRLETIGAGDFEAETCQKLEAIGVVGGNGGSTLKLGAIYSASSPNADVREPVVVSADLSTGDMTIDSQASSRASDAGATTIPSMRKLIGK